MSEKQYDWTSIANSPKFVALCNKKHRFLFGWWLTGTLVYFLLLVGAGYTPGLFKIRLVGRINVGYGVFLLNFLTTWAIALFYAYKADREFDHEKLALLDEIDAGGKK